MYVHIYIYIYICRPVNTCNTFSEGSKIQSFTNTSDSFIVQVHLLTVYDVAVYHKQISKDFKYKQTWFLFHRTHLPFNPHSLT